jgi:uncharacterized protein YeaO (DUF488 family)
VKVLPASAGAALAAAKALRALAATFAGAAIRVSPRGMRKDAARLDEWAKEVAPSAGLRTWYHHDPAKFGEFRRRHTAELAEPGAREAFARLRALAADRPVTLLTATRDLDLSQAAVPAGLLRETT